MGNPVSLGRAAIAIVVLGVGGAGCTTVHPLVYANAQDLAAEIKPNTRLRIVTVDRTRYDLNVTTVADGTISGILWKTSGRGVPIRIPLNKVRKIDLLVPAPGKTAALAGGVVAFFGLINGLKHLPSALP